MEKKVENNSIENTSAKDSRNGKEIAKNTAFRAAVNQDPKVDFTFSIPSEKKSIFITKSIFHWKFQFIPKVERFVLRRLSKGQDRDSLM